jgi:hypothetical protein
MKSISHANLYDNASLGSGGPGFLAFKQGFYSQVNTLGCNKCHDQNVSPYFASSQINVAYGYATGNRTGSSEKLVDFANPQSSVFIEYAGNSHCGDLPCSNTDNKNLVRAQIDSWAAAEMSNSDNGGTPVETVNVKFLTQAVRAPANIPQITAATPAVLRFELSALNPAVPGLQNALLELEIQMAGTNMYRINRPRIIGSTANLQFSGIRLYIKSVVDAGVRGKEDLSYSNNWHNVQAVANIFARPATLPTGPVTGATPLVNSSLYYTVLSGDNYFTVGFEDISAP